LIRPPALTLLEQPAGIRASSISVVEDPQVRFAHRGHHTDGLAPPIDTKISAYAHNGGRVGELLTGEPRDLLGKVTRGNIQRIPRSALRRVLRPADQQNKTDHHTEGEHRQRYDDES